MQPVPVVVQAAPAFSPIPVFSLDLFVHECIHSLQKDDPEDTLASIESFGISLGSKLASDYLKRVTVPNFTTATRVLGKILWPLIFGHQAEISDRPPHVLEDPDFSLLRRHSALSTLYAEISVFAVCFARGVFSAFKTPCSVLLDTQAPLGRLRLVMHEI